MTNKTVYRAYINKAIWNVITTQYKKDAKGAHETVKAAGYEIYKYDGRYRVSNKKTDKATFVSWESYRGIRISVYNLNSKGSVYVEYGQDCPIDFMNYLETPLNREYRSLEYRKLDRYSEAVGRYKQIQNERHEAKYYGEKIEELKKKITDLTESIEYYARAQLRREQKAEALKKEFGLA